MIFSNFKAVIFDMDGTLVNNMNWHETAWMQFLQRHGIHVSHEEFEKKNYGIITEIVPRFFDTTLKQEEIIRLGNEKETLYRELYRPHLQLIAGAKCFLDKLQANGVKIGLATAADRPNIDFTIDGLGIRPYFLAITGGEEVTKGKPDPEVYLHTAEKLGTSPADCLVMEDSITGIKAGLSAGMQVMAITSTHIKEELDSFPLYKIVDDYIGL